MRDTGPVSENVNEQGGRTKIQGVPLSDNAPAISGDQGMHIPSAPTTHINEMPCNKVTQSPAPAEITKG